MTKLDPRASLLHTVLARVRYIERVSPESSHILFSGTSFIVQRRLSESPKAKDVLTIDIL